MRGTNPPKKYPAAIVRAELIGVRGDGGGSLWWNCIMNAGSSGEFEREETIGAVLSSGRLYDANTSCRSSGIADGVVDINVFVA